MHFTNSCAFVGSTTIEQGKGTKKSSIIDIFNFFEDFTLSCFFGNAEEAHFSSGLRLAHNIARDIVAMAT